MRRFSSICLFSLFLIGSCFVSFAWGEAVQPVQTSTSPIDRLLDTVVGEERDQEQVLAKLVKFRRLVLLLQKRPNLSASRKHLISLIDAKILERIALVDGRTQNTGSSSQPVIEVNEPSQIPAVFSLTNKERQKYGVGLLKRDAVLDSIAQRYAEQMKKDDTFSHEGKDGSTMVTRVKAGGYLFRALAENLAMGVTDSEDVVDLWMNSPGHKKNLLNPTYTHIGLGYVDGYRVQVFALPQ